MTPERFEARSSLAKTGLFVLVSLAFVGAGIWFVTDRSQSTMVEVMHLSVRRTWFGGGMILFFGLTALAWLRQMAARGPVIRIGPEGLRWSRWSDSVIPWAAIVRAEEFSIRRQRFLALWLRDPAAYRSTGLAGRLQGPNRAMGFGDIALGTHGTDRRFQDMVAAIRAHAPHLLRA